MLGIELPDPEAKLISRNVVAAARQHQGIECSIVRILQIIDDLLALFDSKRSRGGVAIVRQTQDLGERGAGPQKVNDVPRERIVEPRISVRQNIQRPAVSPRGKPSFPDL